MKIKKRNGTFEKLSFDRISYRLKKLSKDPSLGKLNKIDIDVITQKVVSRLYDEITSSEIDEESARIAINMIENEEYPKLAARIVVSNLHKNTIECFSEVMGLLHQNVDSNGNPAPIVSDVFMEFVTKYKNELNEYIDYTRDYIFDYFGFKTLEKSYLFKINGKVVERPQHMYMRVAVALNRDNLDDILKTYDLISQGYYTHASPTLFNAGKNYQNFSSCFLLGTEDSMEGIFKTISDCAIISKMGGGIGVHISNIRAKGSVIRKTNGKSDGIVPMLKVYNETSCYSNQSGARKGSFAIYLEPWHADIMAFLDLRKNQGHENVRARDLFYALWIPDLFMEKIEKNEDWYLMCPDECPGLSDVYGEEFEKLYNKYVQEKRYKTVVKAQEVWFKVLEAQIETGTPYLLYKDSVNKKSNQKNVGVIKSSNLCVAPETMILTSKGYYSIEELENKEVEVWNGQEWSKTVIQKTGENQNLIKVVLSNGSELECTEYHKFYIATGKRPSNYPIIKQIEAKNLKPSMKLIKSNFPIIKDGLTDFNYPYEHGLFSADGTLEGKGKLPRITLYGNKKEFVNNIETRIDPKPEDKKGRINCRLPINIKEKYTVPVNYNLDIKLRWLEGLVDGDGCICKSENMTAIQVSSIHKDFLENVKYMLQTMGCDPKICVMHEEHQRDGYEYYDCKKCYRLLITSWDVAQLCNLGFKPNRLLLSGEFPRKNTKRWIQVKDVITTNRISDTYCFKEEKRGMGIFNGILTGQCSEITLVSNDKETAVCNLASIALPKYIETDSDGKQFFNHQKLYDVAKFLITPMNRVIDYNYYPTKEAELSNFKHRPLGIGIQGLHDVFIMMKLNYSSEGAKKLNKEIFETIYYATLSGSNELAKKDGPYETFQGSPMSEGILQFDMWENEEEEYLSGRWDWNALKEEIKKHGVRNSMLTTCMPTASTAQILGNCESIEPFDSCIFKRRVLSGEYLVVNKHLIKDLLDLKLWNKDMKDLIIANGGSIQNIDIIPQNIKNIYKTVWEISMKDLINLSADRARFIDHTQSLNLFMANPTFSKLTSMHFYGWKKGLKTGIYYLRSKGASDAGKFSVDPELERRLKENEQAKLICSLQNKEECMMCSS